MTQTRTGSAVEAVTNVLVGLGISQAANMVILPAYGFASLTHGIAFQLGLIYTGISLARSFLLRRFFNGLRRWRA